MYTNEMRKANEHIRSLEKEIGQLRNLPSMASDTVTKVEIRYYESPLVAALSDRVRQLEGQQPRTVGSEILYLGEQSQLGAEVLVLLDRQGILHHEDGKSYLVFRKHAGLDPPARIGLDHGGVPVMALYYPDDRSADGLDEESEKDPIDDKTAKALAKHYGRGIGVKIGPTADFAFSDYDLGKSEAEPNLGLLTDLILSPSLSVETGIKYGQRLIEIRDPSEFGKRDFPDQNEFDGELSAIEIDGKFLEIPINLKYRRYVAPNLDLTFGLGFSSYIAIKEDLEYTYNNVEIAGGQFLDEVRSDQPQGGGKIYPGNMNFILGVNHALKDRRSLEGAFFYQHGVGNVGFAELSPNFFGLRGVYWFTVR